MTAGPLFPDGTPGPNMGQRAAPEPTPTMADYSGVESRGKGYIADAMATDAERWAAQTQAIDQTNAATMEAIKPNPAVTAAAYGSFLLAVWKQPTARARNLLVGTWASTIGGFFLMDFANPVETGEAPTGWLPNATATVWSWLLWFAAATMFILWVREIQLCRQAARLQAQAQNLAHAATVEHVHPTERQEPAEPAPAAPETRTGVARAPSPTTELWLPSDHVRTRRVRRGGETLTGTPIKDRRTVDPRTL